MDPARKRTAQVFMKFLRAAIIDRDGVFAMAL